MAFNAEFRTRWSTQMNVARWVAIVALGLGFVFLEFDAGLYIAVALGAAPGIAKIVASFREGLRDEDRTGKTQ